MHNRLAWIMGTLIVAATLAAVGVGFAGYRQSPAPLPRAAALVTSPSTSEDDPLAPRLFDQASSVRVHVAGAVKKPGVYTLPSWARVIDAVKKAGGHAVNADLDGINLADRIRDGEQIRIPVRGRASRLEAHQPTPEPPAVPQNVGGRGTGRYPFAAGSVSAVQGYRSATIDLNTAGPEELDRLPGVGPATAAKIIAHRREHGPFLRAEDLMNVKGIGPAKFERMRPMIGAP
jgi:competence ComEA-like helix-hairpin-helix protein